MNTKKILDKNKKYTVYSEYETVYLYNKKTKSKTIIGDFYGDPNGAVIDCDKRFILIYGCGLIIYFLKHPYQQYKYNYNTSQWIEYGRNEPIIWIDKVIQKSRNELILTLENGNYIFKLPVSLEFIK